MHDLSCGMWGETTGFDKMGYAFRPDLCAEKGSCRGGESADEHVHGDKHFATGCEEWDRCLGRMRLTFIPLFWAS